MTKVMVYIGSERTVRNYLSSAIQQVGARNRMEAMRPAEAQGRL
jgi:DNA-binding CsgD family transcriptional regulator